MNTGGDYKTGHFFSRVVLLRLFPGLPPVILYEICFQ